MPDLDVQDSEWVPPAIRCVESVDKAFNPMLNNMSTSAWGHLQTFAAPKRKSALPPKADVRVTHVMSDMGQQETSPLARCSKLFDHLIGTQQE